MLLRRCHLKKLNFLLFLLSALVVYYIFIIIAKIYSLQNTPIEIRLDDEFLISTSSCDIRRLDPFNSDALKHYIHEDYISCWNKTHLTHISKTENDTGILYVRDEAKYLYTNGSLQCCYSYITRVNDKNISLSECIQFENSVTLTQNLVKVKCLEENTGTLLYENIHTYVSRQLLPSNAKPLKNKKDLSVLMVGIDSVSALSFARVMPNTKKYLEERNWINLKGYTKIGYKTYDNLMAILTGYDSDMGEQICKPTVPGFQDNCTFLWNEYRKHGYVTAFSEDEIWMDTFNYRKAGFVNPPTDFYFRPYFLGAYEHLKTGFAPFGLRYCTGPENTGERTLNIIRDFVTTLKEYATFGFFWMNSFSHNDVNLPGRLDNRFLEFFQDLQNTGALDRNVVVFFSDHGVRFGSILQTFSGWYEERLPFIYVSFPSWFKEKYPEKFKNFKINSKRLTTPYDIYMTLQEILTLSKKTDTTLYDVYMTLQEILTLSKRTDHVIRPSKACPKCHSLFAEVDLTRTCADASIPPHICTCNNYIEINHENDTVITAAKYVLNRIQRAIKGAAEGHKCHEYTFGKILYSYISLRVIEGQNLILLGFELKPKALFATVVGVKKDSNGAEVFSMSGKINRIEQYGGNICTESYMLEVMCVCKGNVTFKEKNPSMKDMTI